MTKKSYRTTSVSLRIASRAKLRQSIGLLKENGLKISEQRILRLCLRQALNFWRGNGCQATRTRRYNLRKGRYVIVPLFISEELRAVLSSKVHHGGLSLSRFADFAISHYLERVIEEILQFPHTGRDAANVAFWQSKFALRSRKSDFSINYENFTEVNDRNQLKYYESIQISPHPRLFRLLKP